MEAIQSEAASATANETLRKPRGAAVTGGHLLMFSLGGNFTQSVRPLTFGLIILGTHSSATSQLGLTPTDLTIITNVAKVKTGLWGKRR